MIDKKTLNTKWNDWGSDTLYLWSGESMLQISEGDGSNLEAEDEEEGFVDYWYTEVYSLNSAIAGGGIWLETKLIADQNPTIAQVIERIKECETGLPWNDNWRVLTEDEADKVEHLYQELFNAKINIMYFGHDLNRRTKELEEGKR